MNRVFISPRCAIDSQGSAKHIENYTPHCLIRAIARCRKDQGMDLIEVLVAHPDVSCLFTHSNKDKERTVDSNVWG